MYLFCVFLDLVIASIYFLNDFNLDDYIKLKDISNITLP